MECEICDKKLSFWEKSHRLEGMNFFVCPDCYENRMDEVNAKVNEATEYSYQKIDQVKLDKIILTTETYSKDFEIVERLGIISSEAALGMNMFRDIFANVRDIVGGKSVSTQKILKDLKSNAFQELKEQAYNLNANAVVAIDLDYSEFSGGGKSMLFLVASGTAVILEENASNKDPS